MSDVSEITASKIRDHMLARATAYSERTKSSFSFISREAVKDDRFLARAGRGANFTVETYQRMIDWLDAREADEIEQHGAAA
jgi:hypothetical protein